MIKTYDAFTLNLMKILEILHDSKAIADSNIDHKACSDADAIADSDADADAPLALFWGIHSRKKVGEVRG